MLDPGVELDISLREDFGSFAGRIPTPGEYAIGGVDAEPSACGVCVSVSQEVPL